MVVSCPQPLVLVLVLDLALSITRTITSEQFPNWQQSATLRDISVNPFGIAEETTVRKSSRPATKSLDTDRMQFCATSAGVGKREIWIRFNVSMRDFEIASLAL